MKKLILFTLIIISCNQFSVAQKIYLTYKIKTKDSLFIFQDKAFSDNKIEANAQSIFQKQVQDRDIFSIDDDLNRKFVKLEINHQTYFPKLLNTGFYTLYQNIINDNSRYYACSKTDTLILKKKDSLNKKEDKKDLNFYITLATLSKDHTELWRKAKLIKFDTKEIQGFISELNSKYPETSDEIRNKSRFDYLSISLKGFVLENKTDIMLDVFKSYYFIESPNISLRYGFKTNYYKLTEFFPEFWTGSYYIHDGIVDSIFNYRNHYETLTAKIFELPFSVNFEITNSFFTPYLNFGLAPVFYNRKISRTDSNEIQNNNRFTFNAFAATGVKLKLTNKFNVMAEYRWDLIKRFNFLIGLEYFFRPHKHL